MHLGACFDEPLLERRRRRYLELHQVQVGGWARGEARGDGWLPLKGVVGAVAKEQLVADGPNDVPGLTVGARRVPLCG